MNSISDSAITIGACVEVQPLPLTISEITASWMSLVLSRRLPGVSITDLIIEDVIAMTSTKIRVRLQYNEIGQRAGMPPTLIVKGGFGEHSPAMRAMYRNEADYYGLLAPSLAVNAPRCYYAGTDPHSHQSIVILEDLALRGVTFCNVRRPLGYELAAAFMDALAGFHAQTWDSPDFASGGKYDWVKPRFDGGYGTAYYYDRYLRPDYWTRMIAGIRGAVVAQKLHDHAWAHAAMGKIFDFHRRFPNCAVHGDCHVGNTYHDRNGAPGFIDFQPTCGPWQMDVTKFLVGALDIVDRRQWERSLLTRYLDGLKSAGVSAPCVEEAWEAHRREAAYGFIVFVVNENIYQTEDVNLGYLVRYATAVIDLGSKELLS